ncbi:MAG: Hsp70 family protein, partial [Myxococcales bacterium]
APATNGVAASPNTTSATPRAPVEVTGGQAAPQVVAETPLDRVKKLEGTPSGPMIGIDLGTTYSCAAYVKNGRPFVIPSREGYNTVPSIVAVSNRNKILIGHPAKGQMLTNPRQTVYGSKRLVGRPFNSTIVRQIKDRFAYEIIEGPRGESAVRLGGRAFSLQELSAMVLCEVKDIAQNHLGQPVERAIITVPAYYNEAQRQAVREAGALAGLHVERILNEPTAAALAFGYGRELQKRILIYDLGGGTFDASLLELNGHIYEVISTGGDTFLGGVDFDMQIVDHLLLEFQASTGKVFQGDRVALQRLIDAAERAKIALSEAESTQVRVPFLTIVDGKPYDLDVTLTRQTVIDLCRGLVERTLQVCDEVLKARNLTPADVDEIIPVGGMSRMPLVRDLIEQFFKKPPHKGVHPDEAVALGAALLAHSLEQVSGVVLIDVLPMSIGIGLPGGRFKKVIERNTPLPHSKTYGLATFRDDQRELELTVFQGDGDRVEQNEL